MKEIESKEIECQSVKDSPSTPSHQEMFKIIAAASSGTLIEWFDFFTFGTLSTQIASKFYQTGTDSGDIIAWLSAFAAGFLFRPLGAVLFGLLGDTVGRKYTFFLSLLMMGGGTTLIGCLPTIHEIGIWASILLVILRIIQGLAVGGEYGGAAIFISETCDPKRRGFYTSFIQITATLGLLSSLIVILIVKESMTAQQFDQWGWRIPFLLSAVLILGSFYIRQSLHESPLFLAAKEAREKSGKKMNPLVESFTNKKNLYYILVALFGIMIGQGVVWYTAQFYTLNWLQTSLGLDFVQAYLVVGVALVAASPLFILVGHLSDKYGRKPFILAGQICGALFFYPLFMGLRHFGPFVDGNLHLKTPNPSYSPVALSVLVFIMVVFAALVYSPCAAILVELFPTSVRYTSLSVPYHIGAGIFGGLVPVVGLSITTVTGDIFGGLYYPIAVAVIGSICMILFVPETKDFDISRS